MRLICPKFTQNRVRPGPDAATEDYDCTGLVAAQILEPPGMLTTSQLKETILQLDSH